MDYDALRNSADNVVRDGAGFDAYCRPGVLIDSGHASIQARATEVAGQGSDRVKALEEELSRIKSTTPAMAEAAARAELSNLKQQLEGKQQELDALKAQGLPLTSRWPSSQL